MRPWFTTLILGASVAAAAPAAAQDVPLSFEVRLDAGIPVQDTDDLLDRGVGFGARAMLELAPSFAIYGGYSRMEFELDDDFGIDDGDVEEDGFELGGRVSLGYGHGSTQPYFLLGALFHDDETGLEAGLGADYPVSWNLSVTPEVRYRTIEDLDYLTLGIGLRFRP
jgi:opacity protein-like surface antigen